jgi:hypothetical protein
MIRDALVVYEVVKMARHFVRYGNLSGIFVVRIVFLLWSVPMPQYSNFHAIYIEGQEDVSNES